MRAPEPSDEAERLEILAEYDLLDTPAEEIYDRIAGRAAECCETPIALISLVDKHRQWFKARHGIDAEETSRDVSFCAHAVHSGVTLIVEDAEADARFAGNDLVVSGPGIRFYAGVPLKSREGHVLGTLCVIDTVSRKLSKTQRESLEKLADDVESRLGLRRLSRGLGRILDQKELLFAMVGHDLMNPLTSAISRASMLLEHSELPHKFRRELLKVREDLDDLTGMAASLQSVAASDRGIEPRVARVEVIQLLEIVRDGALRKANTRGRGLRTDFDLDRDVVLTDPELVKRIVRNLLDNAIKHAPKGTDVEFFVRLGADGPLVVRISDRGPGVPEEDRARIFDPFVQLADKKLARRGMGLGLAFVRLAVEALNGRCGVEDRPEGGAVFFAEIPVEDPPPN